MEFSSLKKAVLKTKPTQKPSLNCVSRKPKNTIGNLQKNKEKENSQIKIVT
jgi:hypothetical protein